MKLTSHTTSVVILGLIAIATGYDALAVVFGWHASISECVTNGLHTSTIFALIFGLSIGILLGHWWFSVNYNGS